MHGINLIGAPVHARTVRVDARINTPWYYADELNDYLNST